MPNELEIKTSWAREYVSANLESEQLAYAQLELSPQLELTRSSAALNLVLVLDRSGSMGQDNKLNQLKQAVCQVVDLLRPEDYLGVVLFDERPEILLPSQAVSDKNQLKATIMSFSEQGGTTMSLGLHYGFEELKKTADQNLVSRLLLLTDGQTWGDEAACIALATGLGQAGIPLYAFGLGDEWNLRLLQQLAEQSGGSYEYLVSADQIGEAFNQMVTGMQQIVASKVQLLLRLSSGFRLRAAYRLTPLISNLAQHQQDERNLQLTLGDIERGQPHNLLLSLLIPTRQPGPFRVGQLQLDWVAVDAAMTAQQLRQDLVLQATTDQSLLELPLNPGIMNSLEKAQAFRLQTVALDALSRGDKGLATIKLKQQASVLQNLGETGLSEEANQQAQQLEAGGNLNSAATIRLARDTQRIQ